MKVSVISIYYAIHCASLYVSCVFLTLACGVNCHRRCQHNMAHTCGINSKEFSDLLKQIQLSPEKLNNVTKVSDMCLHVCIYVMLYSHVCVYLCYTSLQVYCVKAMLWRYKLYNALPGT